MLGKGGRALEVGVSEEVHALKGNLPQPLALALCGLPLNPKDGGQCRRLEIVAAGDEFNLGDDLDRLADLVLQQPRARATEVELPLNPLVQVNERVVLPDLLPQQVELEHAREEDEEGDHAPQILGHQRHHDQEYHHG